MSQQAKRFGLMMVAVSLISVVLVACQSPSTPTGTQQGPGGVNVFHTPNPALDTPTPTFPPFTIGAWMSNFSPATKDTITIYVLCKIQDQAFTGPSQPAVGQTVTISIGPPINQANAVKTDSSGLGAWPLQINDNQAGVPVQVTVSTSYKGQSYSASTFFTPSPGGNATPTKGPKGTPPSGSPQPSPTGGLP
ncbi:MAG TPA: hypothetical protein VFU78_18645 [Thermomicrobiales bacterium]|nr:hypothetical protein [Thermomicrobiales bacterium]